MRIKHHNESCYTQLHPNRYVCQSSEIPHMKMFSSVLPGKLSVSIHSCMLFFLLQCVFVVVMINSIYTIQ